MNFEPIMNDEQKEQARQLNLIGELDRLHRVNWELQHKVDGLTLLLNEKAEETIQLRRAMHDIYEVYAGIDGYLFDESKAYREQQFKAMADIAAEHKL